MNWHWDFDVTSENYFVHQVCAVAAAVTDGLVNACASRGVGRVITTFQEGPLYQEVVAGDMVCVAAGRLSHKAMKNSLDS